jgi:hypothetical protein
MTHIGNRGGGSSDLRPRLGEAAVEKSSPKGDGGGGLDQGRLRHRGGGSIHSGRRLRDREEEDSNRGFRVHCAKIK